MFARMMAVGPWPYVVPAKSLLSPCSKIISVPGGSGTSVAVSAAVGVDVCVAVGDEVKVGVCVAVGITGADVQLTSTNPFRKKAMVLLVSIIL
jgi:hypothetical protein